MTQKWFSYPLNWISLLPPDKKLDFVRTGAIVRSYHSVMNCTEYATKPSFQMQKKTFCNRIAFSDVSKMPSPDVFGKKSLRVAGI